MPTLTYQPQARLQAETVAPELQATGEKSRSNAELLKEFRAKKGAQEGP